MKLEIIDQYIWIRDAHNNIKIEDLSAVPKWAWEQLTPADQTYIINTYGVPSYAITTNSGA